jgi:hypothetical protein
LLGSCAEKKDKKETPQVEVGKRKEKKRKEKKYEVAALFGVGTVGAGVRFACNSNGDVRSAQLFRG